MFTCLFILRNLVRQPVTSALTLAGVSLGIATVVALGAVTRGVESSALLTLQAGNADFVVAQRTSGGLMFSSMTEEDAGRLERMEGVDFATAVIVFISRVGRDPFFRTIGIEPVQLQRVGFPVVEGRPLEPGVAGEAFLGDRAAHQLGARTGETVTMAGRSFVVSGIFRTGNRWLDAGAFAPMDEVQELAARPGLITMVYMRSNPPGSGPRLAEDIRLAFPHLTTISNLSEFGEVDQGLRVLSAMNVAVTAIAAVVAAVGVMNTMARSVFERTREIGILRAIGWRKRRVLGMVVGEAVVLCLIGGVAGSVAGAVATETLEMASQSVRSLVGPAYGVELFVRSAALALAVALAGAVYPAYRAARLEPLDALRSE